MTDHKFYNFDVFLSSPSKNIVTLNHCNRYSLNRTSIQIRKYNNPYKNQLCE